jgi:hypothetical protein
MPFVYFNDKYQQCQLYHTTPPYPYIHFLLLLKITCPPQKLSLYLNKKTYKQKHFMNALLIIGWATLATWTIPNTIKDEELRYGVRLVLGSMSIGVLIGALAF